MRPTSESRRGKNATLARSVKGGHESLLTVSIDYRDPRHHESTINQINRPSELIAEFNTNSLTASPTHPALPGLGG